MIDWTAFTWEAFATLVTGLAAVLGAVLVGLRQVRIAVRQVEIGERQLQMAFRQIEIADIANRANLFDRRIAVYRSAIVRMQSIVYQGTSDVPDEEVTRHEFFNQHLISKFLFRPAVYDELTRIELKSWKLKQIRIKRQDIRAHDKSARVLSDAEEAEVLIWFAEELRSLHSVFEPDLGIIDPK